MKNSKARRSSDAPGQDTMIYLVRARVLGELIWIAFDQQHQLRSQTNESRDTLIARWEREHHQRVTRVVRFQGICSEAEAIVCMTSVRRPTTRSC